MRLALALLVAGCSAAWVPDWLRDPTGAQRCVDYCPMACAGTVCLPSGMRVRDAGDDE